MKRRLANPDAAFHPRIRGSSWSAGFAFRAYGLTIGIRTTESAVLGEVRKILPYGWAPCPDRRVDLLYSIDIPPPGSTGLPRTSTLCQGSMSVSRSRSVKTLLETLESLLAQTVAERSRAGVFVHGGAVEWLGQAIVIPGRSFSGKSFLVEAFIRAGAGYLSDEYAIIDSLGRVRPYARPIALRLPGEPRPIRTPVEELGGLTVNGPLPVGMVLVTTFREGARFRPRPLSSGEVLLSLLANTVSARTRPQAALTRLQRVASRARGLRGVRGGADETVAWILDRRRWATPGEA